MTDQFQVWLPFTKVARQPDGSILVHSVINDEVVDDQGEQVAYEAVKAASDDYMKWAAVREMHQPSAVGSMVSLTHDDLTKMTEGVMRIVDTDAIAKVEAGIYKGTSLGGRKGTRELVKVGGQNVTRLNSIEWVETSLVDRPSRPTAYLTLMKRSEGDTVDEPVATIDEPTDPHPDDPVEDVMKAAAPVAAEDALAKVDAPPPPDPATADAVPDPAAAEPAAEPAADPAADGDASTVQVTHQAIENIVGLIGKESKPDALGKLRAALKALQEYVTIEVGSMSGVAKAAMADLAKAAADDMSEANWIASSLARLITRESQEEPPDTDGVAQLQRALAIVLAFAAGEAKEIGTTEDAAVATAEQEGFEMADASPVTVMAYAAVIGDLQNRSLLAKAGARNAAADQVTINSIHDLSVKAGAYPGDHQPAAGTEVAKAAVLTAEEETDRLMKRAIDAAPFAKQSDIDAMKAELLEAFTSQKEELAKIAAQPMPGGPVRYAPDGGRHAESTSQPPLDMLKNAIATIADPSDRQRMSEALAAQEIKRIHTGGE